MPVEDDSNDGDVTVGEGHQDSDDGLPSVLATRSNRHQHNTMGTIEEIKDHLVATETGRCGYRVT